MPESSAKSTPSSGKHEEPLRAAVEHMSMGIAQLTPEGEWSMVNRRLCEILGYSEKELLETSFKKLFQFPEMYGGPRSRGQTLSDDTLVTASEIRGNRKDGLPIWLKVIVSVERNESTKQARGLFVLVQARMPSKNVKN